MVSGGNLLKIGGIAGAGLIIYLLAKNAGNIGGLIGGGLAKAGSDFIGAFTSPFENLFKSSPAENPNLDKSTVPTVDGINTANDLIVQAGGKVPFDPNATFAAETFRNLLEQSVITPEFAQRFSFQPPATGGRLDVSDTFRRFQSEISFSNPAHPKFNPKTPPFGGFRNESAQDAALAAAIERSSTLFPEFFA